MLIIPRYSSWSLCFTLSLKVVYWIETLDWYELFGRCNFSHTIKERMCGRIEVCTGGRLVREKSCNLLCTCIAGRCSGCSAIILLWSNTAVCFFAHQLEICARVCGSRNVSCEDASSHSQQRFLLRWSTKRSRFLCSLRSLKQFSLSHEG